MKPDLGKKMINLMHFTVDCSETCPLNGSEAGGDRLETDLTVASYADVCCVNKVIPMLIRCIYMLQPERSGHLQSKVTSSWPLVNFCNRNVRYSDRSPNEASVVIIHEG